MFGTLDRRAKVASSAEYVKKLRERLEHTYHEARASIGMNQQAQKTYYDQRAKVQKFDVGDIVYRRKTEFKKGESKKLNEVYSGPFLVIQVLSPFLLRVAGRKKTLVLHHDKLRLCHDRDIPFWIRRKRHHMMAEIQAEEPKVKDKGIQVGDNEGEEEVDANDGGETVGDPDLDETLPYGKDGDGEEKSTTPEIMASGECEDRWPFSEDVRPGKEPEIQSLFDGVPKQSRTGRRYRTPSKLKDFITI
jgi:hypothetical protein